MKRLIVSVFAVFFALVSSASHLRVEYSGASIPQKYVRTIERSLLKELEFYGPLGLEDTVRIKVRVFRNQDDADAFLIKSHPTYIGGRVGGYFHPKTQTAYILSTENLDFSCQTVIHEISHFLLRKVLPERVPVSLNEGLAEYFSDLKVRKDGSCCPEIDPGAIGTLKTTIMLGELDLDRYLGLKNYEFKDISRHDASIPYAICQIIVSTMFGRIGDGGVREIVRCVRDGMTFAKAVEFRYPGGKEGLERDIVEFVNAR